MSERDRDILRQAMAEAALLPPEDAIRRSIEEDVARTGKWAQEEWLALLREDEELRLAVRQVPVPPGLEAQLLLIPDSTTLPRMKRSRLMRYVAALAAVVLLGIWGASSLETVETRLDRLAALALADHAGEHPLAIVASDPGQVGKELTRNLGFPISVPSLGAGYRLQGGRPCKLGGRRVGLTVWNTGRGKGSLFQFKLADFGLSRLMGRCVLRPPGSTECRVVIWPEGPMGLALVEEGPAGT